MATTTLYPSGGTYISPESKNTDHSGATSLQTSYVFKNADKASDGSWNTLSQRTDGWISAAFLKFTRSSVLKYAKINSVTLTWVLDGSRREGTQNPQYSYKNWGAAWIAPYVTSYPLSAITWNSFRQNGITGDWVSIGSNEDVNTPSTRTADVTALFNGDQSGDDLIIILAAGQGNYGYNDYYGYSSYILKNSCYLTVNYEAGAQPAPTPLYPRDQTLIEADSTMFSWQFNSETSATQTAVQLEYKNVNDNSYTVLNLTQTAHSYTLNTALPAGSYQWRLKATNDASVTSGYSEVAYFNIVGRPAVPIINTPENKALTTITWNTNNQQSYELILTDQGGEELVHETKATASATYKPNIFLKGQYLVKVRVMNDSMMWSNWAQKGFTISAAGPAAATINLTAQSGIPAICIKYTLPEEADAVLMRKNGNKTEIIAELNDVVNEYIDTKVAGGVVYTYFIRTYVNGYTDSAERTGKVDFDGAIFQNGDEFLHLISSDEQYLPHSEEISAPYALNEFSGRSYYVIERGETITVEISRRFYVDPEQKKLLDRMSLMQSIYYRDNKENAFRAAILKTSYDGHMGDGYLATIRIVRLNEEEVEVNV